MWRLPRADPRPFYPQGLGEDVARALSQVFRVWGSAHRQVFCQKRHGLLQGGFFQVSLFVVCGTIFFIENEREGKNFSNERF